MKGQIEQRRSELGQVRFLPRADTYPTSRPCSPVQCTLNYLSLYSNRTTQKFWLHKFNIYVSKPIKVLASQNTFHMTGTRKPNLR
jgi:hypothetical protein